MENKPEVIKDLEDLEEDRKTAKDYIEELFKADEVTRGFVNTMLDKDRDIDRDRR